MYTPLFEVDCLPYLNSKDVKKVAYPTMAGSRALMIGIALGIVATSFRIIIGLDKSFLGEK